MEQERLTHSLEVHDCYFIAWALECLLDELHGESVDIVITPELSGCGCWEVHLDRDLVLVAEMPRELAILRSLGELVL